MQVALDDLTPDPPAPDPDWTCIADNADCRGGWLDFRDRDGQLVTKRCTCEEMRNRRRRARRISRTVPVEYVDIAFDRWPVTEWPHDVQAELRTYIDRLPQHVGDAQVDDELDEDEFALSRERRGRGLFLNSDGPGTGKTAAAALVAKCAMERGYGVSWWTLSRLMTRLRRTFDDDAAMRDEQLLDELGAVDLLVLDDLAAAKVTEYVRDSITAIVDDRWARRRPTIFTADVGLEDLALRFSDRFVSRLVGICGAPIEFPDGVDFRRQYPRAA